MENDVAVRLRLAKKLALKRLAFKIADYWDRFESTYETDMGCLPEDMVREFRDITDKLREFNEELQRRIK